jgi:hypothetical protein
MKTAAQPPTSPPSGNIPGGRISRRLYASKYVAVLIGIAVALAAIGGYQIWQSVGVSLDAEMTHQAYLRVLRLTTSYIEDQCAWPTNWHDLAAQSVRRPLYEDRWVEEAKHRVVVNFGMTLKELAKTPATDFQAIHPVSPNYGTDETGIRLLLEAAERCTKDADRERQVEDDLGDSIAN